MQINRFGIALHYSEPGVVNILKQRWEQMCVWTSSSENSAEEISFCEHKYSNTMKLFANKAPRVCSLYSAISFSCDSIYSSLRVLFTMAKASNSAPPWTFGRPQTCVFYGLSRFSASASSTLFSSSLCHLPSLCPFLSYLHHYTLTLDFISALKAPSSLFTGPWSDPRVLATVTTLKAKAPFPPYQTTPHSSLVTQHLT